VDEKTMSAEEAVIGAVKEFMSAFARGDLAAMKEVCAHDEAMVFFGTHARHNLFGWPAFERLLVGEFAILEDVRITIEDEQVWVAPGGDVASAATAALTFEATREGQRMSVSGIRMTCALARRGDRFRVVQMHWSVPLGQTS
jgi:ketosteroid isomerase-like protein